MTLIISGVNRNFAFAATDTLVTRGRQLHDSDAIKSMRIDTADGSFLLTYTGLAEIRHLHMDGIRIMKIPTAHAIALELTDFEAHKHPLTEVIKFLKEYLQTYMKVHFPRQAQGLILVFVGWQNINGKMAPHIYQLSNFHDDVNRWLDTPTHDFKLMNLTNHKLSVHGFMPATKDLKFINQRKLTKKLLLTTGLTDFAPVRDSMAKMIEIASSDPQGRAFIGKKIMGSVLSKALVGGTIPALDFRYYPNQPTWIGPNIVGAVVSLIEPKVNGDPVMNGTTIIGGDHSVQR